MLLLADNVVQVYGVGWGTLSMLGAGIAQGKNRSGLNWFLVTLLLGPVGIFLLVALSPKLPDQEIIAVSASPDR
jgi:hypothetical protein